MDVGGSLPGSEAAGAWNWAGDKNAWSYISTPPFLITQETLYL
jgi:hypothetical protein